MNPPPLPTSQPPAPPPPAPQKNSNATLWIVLALVLAPTVIAIIGIGAAIVIPAISKVRETARRNVDISNIREIGKSSLLWSLDHGGALPPTRISADGEPGGTPLATIHSVAAALARDGGLNDATLWFTSVDKGTGTEERNELTVVIDSSKQLDPEFAQKHGFAWDFATGLTTSMPASTPIAWTRGLRTDGTWDAHDGVYGSDGGHIVFLGGNVQFYRDLNSNGGALIDAADGTRTANILEALPANVRVVGDGPGSLNGKTGLAPATRSP